MQIVNLFSLVPISTWNIRRCSFGDKKYLRLLLILNKIENHANNLFYTLLPIKTYNDYCFTSYAN